MIALLWKVGGIPGCLRRKNELVQMNSSSALLQASD